MSRNSLSKRNGEYVGKDFSRYVASLGMSNRAIGEELGVTSQRIGQKRSNNNWTLKDATLIFKLGEATDDEILRIMRV